MDDSSFQEEMRTALIERIGPRRYGVWFDGQVELRRADNQRLLAVAASPLVRDWLVANVRGELMAAAQVVTGRHVDVEFSFAATDPRSVDLPVACDPPAGLSQGPAPATRPGQVPPKDPFRGVVVGEANRAAVAVARRAAAGAGIALLHGGSGVGKTVLLRAACDGACQADRRRRAVYLTAPQFTTEFVEACRGGGLPSFRRKLARTDLLVIDDVQFFVGKSRTLEELQQTIDAFQSAGKGVLLSSDRPLAELRGLGPELASRLAAGVAVELSAPDAAMRYAILQSLVGAAGVAIPEEAQSTLAGGLVGGARELSGALNRWVLEMEINPGADGDRVAARVVELLNAQSQPAVKMADIHHAVSAEYGVEPNELLSSKRTKSVTEPRMLAMWLARRFTRAAWSEIGDYFGSRSHSTVISAHRRIEGMMTQRDDGAGAPLADAVRRIEARLRAC
ncbi:Chromosomal replication initiator protein DnaA [Pirellulimonas nuda]|uniref:Chromosomal replication initiator protein DnaA n=1 Tax=Pirellulimonas nuda TaxID=2528009 RepID=A0A518DB30_9BACT|nr:DnaA/Hda family protein [Pirellulimonas nuda]QDU88653.1 Chromosomal replication initiator protein DnaA [Pirellulimonas nuda]